MDLRSSVAVVGVEEEDSASALTSTCDASSWAYDGEGVFSGSALNSCVASSRAACGDEETSSPAIVVWLAIVGCEMMGR